MKVIHDVKKCIGCGSYAAVCPQSWEIIDGKAHLLGSKKNPTTSNEELEIQEIGCIQDAADICPVQCIKIVKK